MQREYLGPVRLSQEMREAGFSEYEAGNERLRRACTRLMARGLLYAFNDADMIEHGVAGPFNDVEAKEVPATDGIEVALNALAEYQRNWDTGLPAEYASSERAAMECAVEAACEALNDARALLASKAAVPEGWKLVPATLTGGMVDAYRTYWAHTQNIYGAWSAMLAASPTAPAQPCGDAEQADAPQKLCSICHGYGRYQDGNSGTESDGYAPNIVECECAPEERFPRPAEQADEAVTLPAMPENVLADLQSAVSYIEMWAKGEALYVPKNGYDDPGIKRLSGLSGGNGHD